MLSLPKGRSSYVSSKSIYETVQARRRNEEEARWNEWQHTKEYFNTAAVRAAKEKQWSSEKASAESVEGQEAQNESSSSGSLDARREKLRKLLSDESEEQKILLEACAQKSKNKSAMLVRSTALKQARDLENAKLAETLLAQHFKINSPDMRNIERNSGNKKLIASWNVQNAERRMRENQDKLDELMENEMIEESKMREKEIEHEAELQRLEARQKQLESLKRQLDEVHQREAEAAELSRQEKALINQLTKLDSLEKERRNIEEKCKRELYGRSLLRQHHAALRRRAGFIQAELEADKNWLARLAEEDIVETKANEQKKLQEQRNIMAMKEMVEEDLRREKAKEIELQTLDAYEASRVWAQREEQWRREAEARQNLLQQVIEERRAQIAERLIQNQKRQRDELLNREALLESLEKSKEPTSDQEKYEAAVRRRQELDEQVEEKMKALNLEKAEIEAEENATREAETAYEAMLRQEAEKLKYSSNDLDSFDAKQFEKISSRSRSSKNLW